MHAIEAHALCKSFGSRRALWDLSFSVERGEVFGLLGPNGAGKTTALRLLAGLIAPDSGRAIVAGCEVKPGAPGGPQLRGRVGLLTEQPGFYDRLSTLENLVVFGKLQGLTAHEATTRAQRLLERFLLAPHAQRPFAVLSRGMKQKLAIARALLHEPEVILLDEPTVGLDPEATREVRQLVGELAAERRTLVLCTHHLDEVERLCARAAFVAGRLLAVHEVKPLAAGMHRLRIELERPSEVGLEALRAAPFVREAALEQTMTARQGGGGRGLGERDVASVALNVVLEGRAHSAAALALLFQAGARIVSATPARAPLEEAYLSLLGQARAEGLIS